MRASITIRCFAAAIALLAGCWAAETSRADDIGRFSVIPAGHSHHGHHHHGAHHGHRHGHYHGHYNYGYRPNVRLQIGIGSLGFGYGNYGYGGYVPYRSYYYADPYCYGPTYYRYGSSFYPSGVYFGAGNDLRDLLPPAVQPDEFALDAPARDDAPLVLGAAAARPIELKVREVNWDARRRALNFMDRGDTAFSQAQYAASLADYDKAILNAPDMAEGYLRQTLAMLAAGQYKDAADALQRAVTIDPEVTTNARFEIDDLYQGNAEQKKQHLEALAQAALADEHNGNYLVLLGAMLHFDRQILRAEKFFLQAAGLGGTAADTATAFLPEKNGAI